jgi:crotonobetainyl-CoA:carnitine CoA-transferase CaiB-like acyl-CoA transferase
VKVEPLAGDAFAPLCPSWYEEMHRGVSIERLDLKAAEGRARLMALLRDADLFFASHRPSALVRLGLDPETLHREAPRLRSVRIVGSTDAPEVAGHDLTYQAHAGLLRDQLPLTLIADVMASERAVSTALMLLRQPEGTTVDVGVEDSLEPMTAPLRHGLTSPGGVLGGKLAHYEVYPAKEGWIAVAALETHFERRLYERLGAASPSELGPRFQARTAAEWEAWGKAEDVPIAVIA